MTDEDNNLTDGRDLAERVCAILAERLFCKLDEVTLESRLIGDLGVDSLDLIDLQFVLEARLGIRFREGEFFDVSPDWVTKEGFVKPPALERFVGVVPELADVPAGEPLALKAFLEMISVATLVGIVERSLGGKKE